jgi:2-oxoglutarate dehydrogenase E2 component (dihydrolipoamide succinyltransferase)
MPQELVVPPLGESVSEAFIGKWLKADGARVAANDAVLELETDKANVEIRAERAGTLRVVRRDGSVKVGEVVARIEEGAASETAAPAAPPAQVVAEARPAEAKAPAPAAATAPASAGNGEAPPSARRAEPALPPAMRRRLREGGEAPAAPESVSRETSTAPASAALGSSPLPRGTSASPPAASENVPRGTSSSSPHQTSKAAPQAGERRAPMTRLRKRIAERLLEAQRSAAILTTFNEIDMGAVMELRARLKAPFQEAHGVALGFMSFFARACVLALRDLPVVNSEIRGDDIVSRDHVHLGVAVSTERGLVVPVVRHAERMGFADLEREVARLAGLARDGKLAPDDLAGGTFTISNGGVFGSLLSTPILNPPQAAILGMHKIEDRPVVKEVARKRDRVEATSGPEGPEKQVVVRPMMYVALSYDHRLIDGKDSVTFLVRVKERLEDPARLLLEV